VRNTRIEPGSAQQRMSAVRLEMMVGGYPFWGTEMHNPDFSAVARAIGFHAERVERKKRGMILFVGCGWLLLSKLMCDWKAKRQRISRRKEALMARIIEFYVPTKFQRREPLIAQPQKGKVIVFCAEAKKPA